MKPIMFGALDLPPQEFHEADVAAKRAAMNKVDVKRRVLALRTRVSRDARNNKNTLGINIKEIATSARGGK